MEKQIGFTKEQITKKGKLFPKMSGDKILKNKKNQECYFFKSKRGNIFDIIKVGNLFRFYAYKL